MLAIDILRSYFTKNLGVLRGDLLMFGCPRDAQTMVTMLFWSIYKYYSKGVLGDTGINRLTYQKPHSPQENSLAFIF